MICAIYAMSQANIFIRYPDHLHISRLSLSLALFRAVKSFSICLSPNRSIFSLQYVVFGCVSPILSPNYLMWFDLISWNEQECLFTRTISMQMPFEIIDSIRKWWCYKHSNQLQLEFRRKSKAIDLTVSHRNGCYAHYYSPIHNIYYTCFGHYRLQYKLYPIAQMASSQISLADYDCAYAHKTKTKLWTIFSSSSLFILCCCESVVWSFLWRQFVRNFLHSLHTRSPRIYRVNQDLFPPKLGLIHITNGILMTTHKLHFLIVMVLCVCVCLTGFWECVNLYSAHVSPMVIIAWKKWKTFG